MKLFCCFVFKILIMGAESNCCKAVQISHLQYQSTNLNGKNESTFQNQIIQTLKHLGQMQLLASISFQMKFVSSAQQYILNIASHSCSLDQFLQLVDNDYGHNQPFLHLLQSKVYQFHHPRYDWLQNSTLCNQVCIIHQPKLPTNSEYHNQPQVQKDAVQKLKSKLKILQFLRVTQSELQNQAQFMKALCLTLQSIPDSQSYFWDICPKTNFAEMAKHLHYKLNSYLQFLNSYISLNDPLSLLNIKYFLQFCLRFMCTNQKEIQQQIVCKLRLDSLERQLMIKDSYLMSVNFLRFSQKQAVKTKTSNQEVLIILKGKFNRNNKIRDMSKIYLLPLTLFKILEVRIEGQLTKIYLSELQDQFFHDYLSKPLSKPLRKDKDNYASIHKQNLYTQLQSLKHKYQSNLYNYLQNKNKQHDAATMSHIEQIIRKYFENYQNQQELKENNTHFLAEDQKRSAATTKKKYTQDKNIPLQTDNSPQVWSSKQKIEDQSLRQEGTEIESECQMRQLDADRIKKCERNLTQYIKRLSLVKLQNQLLTVDQFYFLTSLNLSHSYLEQIQHMSCFPNLKQLFLYSNEITKIQGLETNTSLRLLSLSRNKIQKLENIEHLSHLRELYVTKNKLRKQSAQYLTKKQFRLLHSLAISFTSEQNQCFQIICKQSPFRLKKLILNQSDSIQQRTKNKLQKKFNRAYVQFCL